MVMPRVVAEYMVLQRRGHPVKWWADCALLRESDSGDYLDDFCLAAWNVSPIPVMCQCLACQGKPWTPMSHSAWGLAVPPMNCHKRQYPPRR